MAQVITLEDYVPAARFDSIPWTQARIEEGATIDGAFAAIQTIAISPVDADPSTPAARSFTTNMNVSDRLVSYASVKSCYGTSVKAPTRRPSRGVGR